MKKRHGLWRAAVLSLALLGAYGNAEAGLSWFSRANCVNNESVSWDAWDSHFGCGQTPTTTETDITNTVKTTSGTGAEETRGNIHGVLPQFIGARDLAAGGTFLGITGGGLLPRAHTCLAAQRRPTATRHDFKKMFLGPLYPRGARENAQDQRRGGCVPRPLQRLVR